MNLKYKQRIERVLQYIEEHLAENPSVQALAEISHFSSFHFHRIFTGIMKETVNDYIARRRMETVANLIIFKQDLPLTQIALDFGFSSSANFSKAVKLYFGFSPSELRNPEKVKNSKIGKLTSKYGKAFNPTDLYPTRITIDVMNELIKEDTPMNITVRKLDKLKVATIDSAKGYEIDAIYSAWDKLIDWAKNNGIPQDDQQYFAMCFDNPTITPIDKCRYTAAVVIDDNIKVNPPFTLSEIPAGKYASLYFKGKQEDTLNAQLSIYSDWLPNSGFEPDNFPMMENYLNDASEDGYVEMEILVKLKEM